MRWEASDCPHNLPNQAEVSTWQRRRSMLGDGGRCRSLGFIANELITNAAKYGKGRITVHLEQNPGKGYALSVSNDGPALPEGFDPRALALVE